MVDVKTDDQLIEECKGYYFAMLEAMQTLANRKITIQFAVDNGGGPEGKVKNNGFVATKKLFEDVPPPPTPPGQPR